MLRVVCSIHGMTLWRHEGSGLCYSYVVAVRLGVSHDDYKSLDSMKA